MFSQNVILTPGAGCHPDPSAPFSAGTDISWMHRARVGDDQGNSSACTLFGIANWIQVMGGPVIPDALIIDVWKRARIRYYGNTDGGLTVPQAWRSAVADGWLDIRQRAEHVRDMSSFGVAPLLGCYEITNGWYYPNDAGCIRHTDIQVVGYHLVLILEAGRVGDAAPSSGYRTPGAANGDTKAAARSPRNTTANTAKSSGRSPSKSGGSILLP